MLTSRVPGTWQDLQREVARVLSECGFAVALERAVGLGRGRAEIDVFAEESIKGRRNLIICECKRWKRTIPQQVVHAFRTVAAETGANTGYIISLKGFQPGAFQATERTNVRLVTWEEFQHEFEPTWLETHFSPTLTRELEPLLRYMGPISLTLLREHAEVDQATYEDLVHRHWSLMMLVTSFATRGRAFRPQQFPSLPIRGWQDNVDRTDLPANILDAVGYADLEAVLLERGKIAITEFRRRAFSALQGTWLLEDNLPPSQG